MRLTLVPVVLLALTGSAVPGAQGCPASNKTSSLVARQIAADVPDVPSLVGDIVKCLEQAPHSLDNVVEGILQDVLKALSGVATGKLPRALSLTSSVPSSTVLGLASSASSLVGNRSQNISSVQKASSSHLSRMRRQAPSSNPLSVLSSSSVLSKLGSATSKLATNTPTSSRPNVGPASARV